MAYTVRIDRIGKAGVPSGAPRIYAAKDAASAATIAAYEVESSKVDRPCIATVTDAAGHLLFTYTGRADSIRG